MSTIEQLHAEIGRLFDKYRVPALSIPLHPDKIRGWAERQATRLRLDVPDFSDACTELFWTVSHIQLALGYALIAREGSASPRGMVGLVYGDQEPPELIGLAEQHFWHHMYNCYECIYRTWERMSEILRVACCLGDRDKLYFDRLVERLRADPRYSANPRLRSLAAQVRHWNVIAKTRNLRSHKRSSTMHALQYEYSMSRLADSRGVPFIRVDYRTKDLREELDVAQKRYERLVPAIVSMQKFIEAI